MLQTRCSQSPAFAAARYLLQICTAGHTSGSAEKWTSHARHSSKWLYPKTLHARRCREHTRPQLPRTQPTTASQTLTRDPTKFSSRMGHWQNQAPTKVGGAKGNAYKSMLEGYRWSSKTDCMLSLPIRDGCAGYYVRTTVRPGPTIVTPHKRWLGNIYSSAFAHRTAPAFCSPSGVSCAKQSSTLRGRAVVKVHCGATMC